MIDPDRCPNCEYLLNNRRRIRLEAVNQANLCLGPRMTAMPREAINQLLEAAEQIVAWVDAPAEVQP